MIKSEYRSWKLHFAIVTLSIAVVTVIVSVGVVIFGFGPVWLLLIPLTPLIVYAIGALWFLIGTILVCEGGAAIVMLLWALVKYLYDEINVDTDIDREFYWTEYFWLAFC